MSLRVKTLAVIGTTLVLLIILITSISRIILLGGYSLLEEKDIIQNGERSLRLIEDELAQLVSVVGDWAPWDDTYEFIEDKNQEYIDDNLADSTINNLPIDFLLYLNSFNSLVYCKYVDPETKTGADCPAALLDGVAREQSLLKSEKDPENTKGIMILPEAPVILASGPILTSQFKGPVNGTLVAGRYLNEKEVTRLAQKINLSIRLQRLDDSSLPDDIASVLDVARNDRLAVHEFGENSIGVYSLLKDVKGKPVLMLAVDKERSIYEQGRRSLFYLVTAVSLTGFAFILAMLFFLESTVLARIVKLNTEVKKIGVSGDFLMKTEVGGNDEINALSTEINSMIDSLRVSTERDRAILETIEDGYFELNLKGHLTFFNNSLARLLRYERDDLQGVNYKELLRPEYVKEAFEAFSMLFKSGKPIQNMEMGFNLNDSDQIYLESTISLICEADGEPVGFRGIARDVTEKKRIAEKMFFLAYHDSLTGLGNRKAFYENLENELQYAARYNQQRSLLFLDLDRFKMVNDSFGHDIGDRLLVHFADRMGGILRNTDHLYRLGGDEFVVILIDPVNQRPETVARRIVESMRKPFQLGEISIDFVTVSIGISVFPLNGKDVNALLLSADRTMYKAKERRNTFVSAGSA